MAGKIREKEFEIFPKYRDLYVRTFDKMLEARKESGLDCSSWQSGEEVMRWWLGYGKTPTKTDEILEEE